MHTSSSWSMLINLTRQFSIQVFMQELQHISHYIPLLFEENSVILPFEEFWVAAIIWISVNFAFFLLSLLFSSRFLFLEAFISENMKRIIFTLYCRCKYENASNVGLTMRTTADHCIANNHCRIAETQRSSLWYFAGEKLSGFSAVLRWMKIMAL